MLMGPQVDRRRARGVPPPHPGRAAPLHRPAPRSSSRPARRGSRRDEARGAAPRRPAPVHPDGARRAVGAARRPHARRARGRQLRRQLEPGRRLEGHLGAEAGGARDLPRRRSLLLARPLPRARRDHRARAARHRATWRSTPSCRRAVLAARLVVVGRGGSASRREHRRRRRSATARRVQRYMTWDSDNVSSHPARSLVAARENARSIREVVSLEAWEAINELLPLARSRGGARRRGTTDRHGFYRNVRRSTQLMLGLCAARCSTTTPLDFIWLGRDAGARRPDRAHPRRAPPRPHDRRAAPGASRPRCGCRCCAPAPASRPIMKRHRGRVTPAAVARVPGPRARLPALDRATALRPGVRPVRSGSARRDDAAPARRRTPWSGCGCSTQWAAPGAARTTRRTGRPRAADPRRRRDRAPSATLIGRELLRLCNALSRTASVRSSLGGPCPTSSRCPSRASWRPPSTCAASTRARPRPTAGASATTPAASPRRPCSRSPRRRTARSAAELVKAWEHLESSHLRAPHPHAPPGARISDANTQPFPRTWGRRDWLFAHAGSLRAPARAPRRARRSSRWARPTPSSSSASC